MPGLYDAPQRVFRNLRSISQPRTARVRFIDFNTAKPDFQTIKAAAELLADDYPIVFPSDTTYGILMRFSAENARRLHALRRENTDKPFLIVVSEDFDWHSLIKTNSIPAANGAETQKLWPGANTLIFEKSPGLSYPPADSIAIRMPSVENNKAFHTLVQLCDFPVMAPSFNRPGEPIITDKKTAEEKFGEIEYAFWDERYTPGAPSAIWDLRFVPPKKIR